jgi:hypothetical protein
MATVHAGEARHNIFFLPACLNKSLPFESALVMLPIHCKPKADLMSYCHITDDINDCLFKMKANEKRRGFVLAAHVSNVTNE